jgi:hypothetical protein
MSDANHLRRKWSILAYQNQLVLSFVSMQALNPSCEPLPATSYPTVYGHIIVLPWADRSSVQMILTSTPASVGTPMLVTEKIPRRIAFQILMNAFCGITRIKEPRL